jgi:hypothetical protein
MGLQTAKETLEHYDCKPAEFILDDYTTFRVVVYSSDYEANNAGVTSNVTDDVTDNVTDNVIGDVIGRKLTVNERQHAILQYIIIQLGNDILVCTKMAFKVRSLALPRRMTFSENSCVVTKIIKVMSRQALQ